MPERVSLTEDVPDLHPKSDFDRIQTFKQHCPKLLIESVKSKCVLKLSTLFEFTQNSGGLSTHITDAKRVSVCRKSVIANPLERRNRGSLIAIGKSPTNDLLELLLVGQMRLDIVHLICPQQKKTDP